MSERARGRSFGPSRNLLRASLDAVKGRFSCCRATYQRLEGASREQTSRLALPAAAAFPGATDQPATLACSHAGLWSQHHEQVLASALHPLSRNSVHPHVGVGRPSILSNEGKKKAEDHRTSSSLYHRCVLAASPPRVPPPIVERRTQRWLPALVAVAFWVPMGPPQ